MEVLELEIILISRDLNFLAIREQGKCCRAMGFTLLYHAIYHIFSTVMLTMI